MGACHSHDAVEPPTSNMQTVATKDGTGDITQTQTTSSANPQSIVPMYVPPAGAWTPEREEEKRRAKLAEIKRQNEIAIERATAHLRQKSSSKDRRSSKHHHRSSLSAQINKAADIEPTEHSAIPSTDSALKPESELSIRSTVDESPAGSVPRQLNSAATTNDTDLPSSGNERRSRAGSLQSTTPSLTRESSRVESRSSNDHRVDKTPRKDWNYDAMPGERGDQVRPRNQSSRHSHSQSISYPASAPSTPPQKRRTTFGESTQLQAVEEVSVSSCTTPMNNIDTTPKPSVVVNDQSPVYQGVKLRSAPVTPRSSIGAAPRVQSVSPTASDASAVFGVKLRKTTPNSPSASNTPVTTVTATVA